MKMILMFGLMSFDFNRIIWNDADDIDTLISHSHRSIIKLTVAATILLDDDGVWYGILLYMYIL